MIDSIQVKSGLIFLYNYFLHLIIVVSKTRKTRCRMLSNRDFHYRITKNFKSITRALPAIDLQLAYLRVTQRVKVNS